MNFGNLFCRPAVTHGGFFSIDFRKKKAYTRMLIDSIQKRIANQQFQQSSPIYYSLPELLRSAEISEGVKNQLLHAFIEKIVLFCPERTVQIFYCI